MIDQANDLSTQSWIKLWRWVLVVSCIGMGGVVLVGNWVISRFLGLGLHRATAIALLMGAIAATALCVILMGLLFYSERIRDDESAD